MLTPTWGDFTLPKTDVYHMCGRANDNGRAALRMYHVQFHSCSRAVSGSQIFSAITSSTSKQARSTMYCRRHLKNLVYAIPLGSDENPVARISEATAREREITGICERVRQLLHRRCQACTTAGERNFEQLL
ncbi:hypothetical protein TNCV_4034051 [Trichonephila clavipes]|nr:hypothetical protein TNCV_4034051 [Trichonephila clavipes]